MSDGLSTIEASGLFGGLLAAAGMIGGGVRWLAGERRRAALSREGKLDRWHEELATRERELDDGRSSYTKTLEQRLAVIEGREAARDQREAARDQQVTALRIAFELTSGALRILDPNNAALRQAQDVLAVAFPVDLRAPVDMIASLGRIEAADKEGSRA